MTLRIALVGPGLIGRKHAELVEKSPNSTLCAVIAPETPANVQFASGHNVPLFGDISTAVHETHADAVIIASPTEYHCEQALECIGLRKPVLVEKPLAATLREGQTVASAAEKAGVPVLVGHHRMHSALLPVARQLLRSAEFGVLTAVTGSALYKKPDDYFRVGKWRTIPPGGGPLQINVIHDVGVLQYLCGPIVSVSAMGRISARGHAVEDLAAFVFRFENGAIGTFITSDNAASDASWEMTAGENPIYPFFPDGDCYHFAGTGGSLGFPSMEFKYYSSAEDASWWKPFEIRESERVVLDPLVRQLQHFEDVVLHGASPIVPAAEGLSNMQLIEAVKSSMASKAEVAVVPIRL